MSSRDDEFDGFVRDQSARLHRLAYLLCGDWHLADDLVQEALAKCFRHWRRVQRSARPEAYVRRILVNEANRHWRRNQRVDRGATGSGAADVEAPAPDGAPLVAAQAALVQTLMALPAGQRAVVVLRHLEDLSEQETALLLGCSVGTVKSQNGRALKTLRTLIHTQETTP